MIRFTESARKNGAAINTGPNYTKMTETDLFARCTDLIRQANGLLIKAGAGMGVDAGLPDFRGARGFWRAYPALAKAGLAFEEVVSLQS
jgi:uncharacterized protein (DUF849 family)